MHPHDKGTKHKCPDCETRFYDMRRTPIICPKCHHPIDIFVSKVRRDTVVSYPLEDQELLLSDDELLSDIDDSFTEEDLGLLDEDIITPPPEDFQEERSKI